MLELNLPLPALLTAAMRLASLVLDDSYEFLSLVE